MKEYKKFAREAAKHYLANGKITQKKLEAIFELGFLLARGLASRQHQRFIEEQTPEHMRIILVNQLGYFPENEA